MMANPQTHASASTHLGINPHYSPHNPHQLLRAHSSPIPHQSAAAHSPSDVQSQMYGQAHTPTYYALAHAASSPGTPRHAHPHSNNPPPLSLPTATLNRRSTAVGTSGSNAPSSSRSGENDTRGQQEHPGSNVFYDFTHVATTNSIRTTRDSNNKYIINQYTVLRRVGKGQHGFVFEAYDQINNRTVAIKSCKRKNTESKIERLRRNNNYGAYSANDGGGLPRQAAPGKVQLYNEIQEAERKILYEIAIMKKLRHGQIVQLYEVINDPLSSKIFMVMEYMAGGEVCWRDKNERPVLTVDQARRICRDVTLGLEFLHHQGIIHRDIKPANLLWTDDRKNVKISDFGVSHHSAALRLMNLRKSMRAQVEWKQKESAAAVDKMRVEVRGRVYKGGVLEKDKGKGKERDVEVERVGRERERHREGGRWRGVGRGKGPDRPADVSRQPSGSEHEVTPDVSMPRLHSTAGSSKTTADTESVDANDPYKNVSFSSVIEETTDPILLTDNEGLSRQAGSPSFIAPEVVWEFRRDWLENAGKVKGRAEKTNDKGEEEGKESVIVNVQEVVEQRGEETVDSRGCSCAPGQTCAAAASANTSASVSVSVSATASSSAINSPSSPSGPSLTSPSSALAPSVSSSSTSKRGSISASVTTRSSTRKRLSSHGGRIGDMNAMVGGYVGTLEENEKGKEAEEKAEKGRGKCWIGRGDRKVEDKKDGEGENEIDDEGENEKDDGTPVPTSRGEQTLGARQEDIHTVEAPPDSDVAEDGEEEEDDGDDESMEPRPEITKAIDVWALGVTLYCLLMGRCPWTGNSEFALYINLRTDDFDVEETMGIDRIPTGGRRHSEGDTSEGAVVVRLLEGLLEKDYKKRITLEEVKRLPWITRDIPNPEAWVYDSSPYFHDPITVTAEEESDVFTRIRFEWKPKKILNKVVNTVNTLTGRSAKNSQDNLSRATTRESEGSYALQRAPSRRRRVANAALDAVDRHLVKKLARHGSTPAATRTVGAPSRQRTFPDLFVITRDRSRSRSRPNSRTGSRVGRGGSGSDYARTPSGSNLTSPSTAGYTSDEILSTEDERNLTQSPQAPFHPPMQLPPQQKERRSLKEPTGRKKTKDRIAQKSRLSLSSIWHHFNNKSDAQKNDKKEALSQRRSTEGFGLSQYAEREPGPSRMGSTMGPATGGSIANGARTGSDPSAGGLMNLAGDAAGPLTAEMRASSWGEVTSSHGHAYGYPRRQIGTAYRPEYIDETDEDADSVFDFGFDQETGLDEQTMMVGAGGIQASPLHSTAGSMVGSRAASPAIGVPAGDTGSTYAVENPHLNRHRSVGRDYGSRSPPEGRVSLPNIPPQQQEWLYDPVDMSQVPPPALRDQHMRQARHQHQMSSPLARTPYGIDDNDPMATYSPEEQQQRDNYYAEQHRRRIQQQIEYEHNYQRRSTGSHEYLEAEDSDLGERVYGNGSAVLDDADAFEEESSSDEEPLRLEVRRRRPSEALDRSSSRSRPIVTT